MTPRRARFIGSGKTMNRAQTKVTLAWPNNRRSPSHPRETYARLRSSSMRTQRGQPTALRGSRPRQPQPTAPTDSSSLISGSSSQPVKSMVTPSLPSVTEVSNGG
jgi:hypothetical protein